MASLSEALVGEHLMMRVASALPTCTATSAYRYGAVRAPDGKIISEAHSFPGGCVLCVATRLFHGQKQNGVTTIPCLPSFTYQLLVSCVGTTCVSTPLLLAASCGSGLSGCQDATIGSQSWLGLHCEFAMASRALGKGSRLA